MKNTKAIFLIILGSFIIATGFAFAENFALSQAEKMLGESRATEINLTGVGAPPVAGAPVAAGTQGQAPATQPAVAATPPAVAAPAAAKPEEKPTFKENLNKYLKDHMSTMAMTAIGAYAGFALLGGPIGLIIGALFMYSLNYMGNNV